MDKVNMQEQLENRLLNFAARIISLINKLPKTASNRLVGNQLIRSSSSCGANYFEATCAHTIFWLKLLVMTNPETYHRSISTDLEEALEIFKIFNSIVKTGKSSTSGKAKSLNL
jgi:hypothetical protein